MVTSPKLRVISRMNAPFCKEWIHLIWFCHTVFNSLWEESEIYGCGVSSRLGWTLLIVIGSGVGTLTANLSRLEMKSYRPRDVNNLNIERKDFKILSDQRKSNRPAEGPFPPISPVLVFFDGVWFYIRVSIFIRSGEVNSRKPSSSSSSESTPVFNGAV